MRACGIIVDRETVVPENFVAMQCCPQHFLAIARSRQKTGKRPGEFEVYEVP